MQRKSQLAIEYSYKVRCQSPETWVFWVHVSNTAQFKQSCTDITDYAKIPGWKNLKADIFKLIHDWLWHKRVRSAIVSILLLKRLNLVTRCEPQHC